MKSIFQRANPAIKELFEKAGSPEKVLCIPIDYAKREHTALACNGAATAGGTASLPPVRETASY